MYEGCFERCCLAFRLCSISAPYMGHSRIGNECGIVRQLFGSCSAVVRLPPEQHPKRTRRTAECYPKNCRTPLDCVSTTSRLCLKRFSMVLRRNAEGLCIRSRSDCIALLIRVCNADGRECRFYCRRLAQA